MEHDCTLVAIARNEERYLLEWIAYHLSIGFKQIIVFDNESTDGSWSLLAKLRSIDPGIEALRWHDVENQKTQVAAYNAARSLVATPWMAFLDIDEFLVLRSFDTIPELLAGVPETASSLHVNWRGFGSSGRETDDYRFVTEAFTRCAPQNWDNHFHFKTIARTERFAEATVHSIRTLSGAAVLSDFSTFQPIDDAFTGRIVYGHCQINHYQCKTYPEFKLRMEQGIASEPPNSPHRARSGSRERFQQLDRNEQTDDAIVKFLARAYAKHDALAAAVEQPS